MTTTQITKPADCTCSYVGDRHWVTNVACESDHDGLVIVNGTVRPMMKLERDAEAFRAEHGREMTVADLPRSGPIDEGPLVACVVCGEAVRECREHNSTWILDDFGSAVGFDPTHHHAVAE